MKKTERVKASRRKATPTSRAGASEKNRLTHTDASGAAKMVDVGAKQPTRRRAVADGVVKVNALAARQIRANEVAKGNVLDVARLAGVMAAKRTDELIPLCHSLPVDHLDVKARLVGREVRLVAEASVYAKTGVEMEAMMAVSIAALTVYDMLKAVDKSIEIGPIRLLEKTGGKSGTFRRDAKRIGPER